MVLLSQQRQQPKFTRRLFGGLRLVQVMVNGLRSNIQNIIGIVNPAGVQILLKIL